MLEYLAKRLVRDLPLGAGCRREESAHETYLSRLQINAGRPYAGPSIKKMMKVESPAKFDNAAIAPMWRSEGLNVLQIASGWRYVGKRNGAFRIRCLGDHG